jgi:uncharacterized repeat protein (TIGR01451 family)
MRSLRQFGVRRRLTFLAIFAAALSAVVFVAGAQAVHDNGPFQLDGDALSSTTTTAATEDWDAVCPASHAPGAASCLGGTSASSSFFSDAGNRVFTGGGSKDDLDISSWQNTVGGSPDKDDLLHGFAARYGDILYFGADRYANNGNSQMGIWFLQDHVAPVTSGPNDGTFAGAHVDGDLLMVSDFTQGGAIPAVSLYRWNGPGGSIPGQGAIDGTLDLVSGTGPDCLAVPAGQQDDFCATVNGAVTPSPWAFDPKSGPSGWFQPGELFEGGIDLSALNLENECFPSVMLETRSSSSTNATLQDYVAGSLELCDAAISIGSDSVSEVGTNQTINVHVSKTIGGKTTGAQGVHPSVTLTASDGAVVANPIDGCATVGTDANGDCSVTFTSNSGGLVTGDANADVVIGASTFHVATAASTVKRFVDASVAVSPLNAVNNVGDPHTFTATVQQDDGFDAGAPGDGATGFGPAPAGTTVTLSLLNNTAGAAFVGGVSTCTTDPSGACSIQINGTTAGSVSVHAATTFAVGGVNLTRETGTGGPNGADGVKTYVAAPGPVATPHISITQTPNTQSIASGSTATFTIVVTNDGNTALSAVEVLDPAAPDCARAVGPLAAGAQATYTCTVQNVTAAFTNTATANGTPPAGPVVTANAAVNVLVTAPVVPPTTPPTVDPPADNPPPTVVVTHPEISIVKDPKTQTIAKGATAAFSVTVTNTGDTALLDVAVSDPVTPDCARTIGMLAPGASVTYTCSRSAVVADFDSVIVATGTSPAGVDVTASDSVHVSVTDPLPPPPAAATHPAISIIKNPKSQSIAVGGTAVFTITVRNTGDVELTKVTVTDVLTPSCSRTIGTLAAGGSVTYTCTKANVRASFDNVAVASGVAGQVTVSALDTAPVKVMALRPPVKHVQKHVTKHPQQKVKHVKPKVHKPKVISHLKPKTTG